LETLSREVRGAKDVDLTTSNLGARQLDLCSTFGPLASMHAALDAAGCGTPCAVSARFQELTPKALERHLLAAASRFPVLTSRLAWIGDRPILQSGTGAPMSLCAPLDFTAVNAPLAWRAAIRAEERGAVLTAVFSHALADGGSMLRLIAEIEFQLGLRARAATPKQPRRAQPPAAVPWLSGFLAERLRSHLVLAPDDLGPMGASWFRTCPEDRDRVIDRARSTCGQVLPFIAAASALAAGELSAGRCRRVSLNIPISRSDAAGVDGFGFGVGSLLLGQDITPSADTESLARRLAPRIGGLAASGWDAGLEWFLGSDPRRHRKFARIRARSSADPTIDVSWKGFDRLLGGAGGARCVACFAAAPPAHVSAHADLGGLSISFTAPRSQAVREPAAGSPCANDFQRIDRWRKAPAKRHSNAVNTKPAGSVVSNRRNRRSQGSPSRAATRPKNMTITLHLIQNKITR
jgi:hypothetical protein